jgi:hypothetical protein
MPEALVITARRIVEDLEATHVDPVAVAHVRNGLNAIADAVRELENVHGLGGHVDAVGRDEILELVDPQREPRA